jgi:hypothetical protein
MSKAHVSSVFDYVVDNEDADSTVCGGVSRLVTEVAVASKYDGNAVVHAVPAARVGAAGGARRGAPVNIGRLERLFLPAVGTSREHEARGNKRRRLELCVAPQLHCGVSMDGSILKVGDDLQVIHLRRKVCERTAECLSTLNADSRKCTSGFDADKNQKETAEQRGYDARAHGLKLQSLLLTVLSQKDNDLAGRGQATGCFERKPWHMKDRSRLMVCRGERRASVLLLSELEIATRM